MSTDAPRLAHSAQVVCTRLSEDEAVLLDLDTQRYYTLNETGTAIWDAFAEPATPSEAAAALARAFDVSPDEALGHVEAFAATLRADGLLRRVEPTGER